MLSRRKLNVPIVTERLTLRPFERSDRDALFVLHSDPEVCRYAGGTKSQDESLSNLLLMIENFDHRGFGTLAITKQEADAAIGYCGVRPLRNSDQIELVYGLRRADWGQGFATEAAAGALERGFEDLGVDRIVALVDPANEASIRVLEKIDMRFVDQIFHEPANCSALLYEKLAD